MLDRPKREPLRVAGHDGRFRSGFVEPSNLGYRAGDTVRDREYGRVFRNATVGQRATILSRQPRRYTRRIDGAGREEFVNGRRRYPVHSHNRDNRNESDREP